MPTNDRKDTNDKTRAHANAPVEDLSPNALDDRAAKQVKGGKGTSNDFVIIKKVDKPTP